MVTILTAEALNLWARNGESSSCNACCVVFWQVLLTAADTGCVSDALAVVSMVSSDNMFVSPV